MRVLDAFSSIMGLALGALWEQLNFSLSLVIFLRRSDLEEARKWRTYVACGAIVGDLA